MFNSLWAEHKTRKGLMMARIMLVIVLMSLNTCLTSPDTSDADTNSGSETSDTSDIDMGLDNKDPNLHNPIPRHGYGGGGGGLGGNPKNGKQLLRPLMTTLAPKTLGQQTVRAALELGVVVGVCLMMGLGFMAMVGLELFCDWVVEEYRRLFKKPKPLPDIERLHPAELVGKFSRYK